MAVNKVIYDGKIIMDVTGDTVTPEMLAEGATATNAAGEKILGTMKVGGGGGKRTCRFIIGTSSAGWTEADCDYLCDGTNDDAEINAAITALPATGGEIHILDGTYNITATIAVNKPNVKISGNGSSTILNRMWNSATNEGIVSVTSDHAYITALQFIGNKKEYTSYNCAIYLNSNGNTVTGNVCIDNMYGIYLHTCENNIITGNTCNQAKEGIRYEEGSKSNVITGNTCNNNEYGMYLYNSNSTNNAITGNTCNNNDYGIYLNSSGDNTITGNTCSNSKVNNIIVYGCYNNVVTGNVCSSTKSATKSIGLHRAYNTLVIGNQCRGAGLPYTTGGSGNVVEHNVV